MPTYAQIIKRSLKQAAANPPRVDHMSVEELRQAADRISADLKGSVGTWLTSKSRIAAT